MVATTEKPAGIPGLRHRGAPPVHNLSQLPDGFEVHQLGETGLSVIENFCTPAEAERLISKARDQLAPSGIMINHEVVTTDYRVSETASVYTPQEQDLILQPLLDRAAMLLGLPFNHVECINVTRYRAGGYYRGHDDFYEGFLGDRLYTVLIYLNTLPDEDGGGTYFEHLKAEVKPRLGRAVSWVNKNPDGSVHPECRHTALPVLNDAEKWVVQLWFKAYSLFSPVQTDSRMTPLKGRQLAADDELPGGVFRI